MSDVLVQFKDVSKTYDGRTIVVRDLNLEVIRGEFLTLLGPSGSGKTTSLMMLAGFEAPTSGQILLEDRVLSRLPPHKRDIGMVFQNYALFPHMSVGENIAFPLQVRGLNRSDIEKRVRRALEMVRLPGVLDRKPSELSGGQQQRVALARALIYEPKIVLMDEPLGALDRQLRESMQREIKALHARIGVTIVYVTHDQSEAITMSDRVAIFNQGMIEQLADPRTLYDRPRNIFVASFVGDNNLVRGSIVGQENNGLLVELPGTGRIVAQGSANVGGPAVVSIRPEKIRILTTGASAEGDNVFNATIESILYLGDHAEVVVRLKGGQTLVSKLNDASQCGPGQEVRVGWSHLECLAFADQSHG